MTILQRQLQIDRWMCRIRCACGAEFWYCELRPLVCPGCRATGNLEAMKQEFYNKGGKDG